jgi:uncharacterized protein YbjT (DUF2867 family)
MAVNAPVLVTGATGYVGKRLVLQLLEAGIPVRALVRDPSRASLPAAVTVARGDVTDAASLAEAVAGVSTVVNLAAVTADRKPPPGGYDAVNAVGTAHLAAAAAAAGVGGFVHMGGIDNGTTEPGPYLRGRRAGEAAVRESGVPFAILQPSIMFGGKDSAFCSTLAGLMKVAPVLPVPGDGTLILQMVWVEDVARCLVELVRDEQKRGAAYPVGGPDHLRYDEVLDLIGEAIGKKRVRKLHLPVGLVRVQARLMQVLPRPPLTPVALELFESDNSTSLDAIEREFGFKPRSMREHVREHGLFA